MARQEINRSASPTKIMTTPNQPTPAPAWMAAELPSRWENEAKDHDGTHHADIRSLIYDTCARELREALSSTPSPAPPPVGDTRELVETLANARIALSLIQVYAAKEKWHLIETTAKEAREAAFLAESAACRHRPSVPAAAMSTTVVNEKPRLP